MKQAHKIVWMVVLGPKVKQCVLKRLAINGFSIYREETGRLLVRVRGMEVTHPDNKMVLQETEKGLAIVEVHGAFRGKGKKKLMQANINTWVLQCSAEVS